MTTTPSVASSSAPARPAPTVIPGARLLMWLPVPALAAAVWLLVEGDSAISGGVADLDPLYGLAVMMIVAIGVGLGLTVVVLAAIFSFMTPPARATGCLATSAWCAVAGVSYVGFVAWGTASDSVLQTSATAGAQVGWQLAAGVVTVLPLVVVLAVRGAAGRRA